jgi:hypothetical protein
MLFIHQFNLQYLGYNSIIGHSNTAHLLYCLPFQNSNLSSGVISLSLSGESEIFKRKMKSYIAIKWKNKIYSLDMEQKTLVLMSLQST